MLDKNNFKNSIAKKWLTLLGTGIAGVTIGIDLTIVNASLPNIQRELKRMGTRSLRSASYLIRD